MTHSHLPLGSNGAGNGALDNWVQALAVSGGDLLAGGWFSNANNNGALVPEADYLAAYGMPTAPDTTPPTVGSITRASPNPTSAASVDFVVTFSEGVTGLDVSDLALHTTSLSGASITNMSIAGAALIVTVNTGYGFGTLRLDVWDDDTLVDLSGNPLGGVGVGNGDFTAGEVYDVARPYPLYLPLVVGDGP